MAPTATDETRLRRVRSDPAFFFPSCKVYDHANFQFANTERILRSVPFLVVSATAFGTDATPAPTRSRKRRIDDRRSCPMPPKRRHCGKDSDFAVVEQNWRQTEVTARAKSCHSFLRRLKIRYVALKRCEDVTPRGMTIPPDLRECDFICRFCVSACRVKPEHRATPNTKVEKAIET